MLGLFIILVLILVLCFVIFHGYFEKRYQRRKYERRYKEVLQEWRNLPNIILYVDEIFEEYGIITPLEYLSIILAKREFGYYRLDTVIQPKYLFIILWRIVNRLKRNDRIRIILREQIKVIDDEELVFAF